MFASDFPKEYIEKNVIQDCNEFNWEIAVTEDGIFFKYLGDEYFKDDSFEIDYDMVLLYIYNTGCFYFETKDLLNSYLKYRDLIINNYTDDIWDCLLHDLTERIMITETILPCEQINYNENENT